MSSSTKRIDKEVNRENRFKPGLLDEEEMVEIILNLRVNWIFYLLNILLLNRKRTKLRI